MKDCRSGGRRVERPDDACVGVLAVVGDGGCRSGMAELRGGRARRAGRHLRVLHRVRAQRIGVGGVVEGSVEEGRRGVDQAGVCTGQLLIDVAVVHGVGGHVELAEVVAVGEVDVLVLAGGDDQMMDASLGVGLVGKQENTAGAEIEVLRGLRRAVVHLEVVGDGELVIGGGEADEGVAVVSLGGEAVARRAGCRRGRWRWLRTRYCWNRRPDLRRSSRWSPSWPLGVRLRTCFCARVVSS